VGADLPLKQKETLRVLPVWLLLDAVETDFGFDIEIYIKPVAESGSAASAAGAVYGINALLGTPFEKRFGTVCHARRKLACGNAHADNVALPFWVVT
jgi:homoserine kinase